MTRAIPAKPKTRRARAAKPCVFCGRVKDSHFRPDPFAAEIREDFSKMWICDDCHYERRQEL
jgi:hypothetical protein